MGAIYVSQEVVQVEYKDRYPSIIVSQETIQVEYRPAVPTSVIVVDPKSPRFISSTVTPQYFGNVIVAGLNPALTANVLCPVEVIASENISPLLTANVALFPEVIALRATNPLMTANIAHVAAVIAVDEQTPVCKNITWRSKPILNAYVNFTEIFNILTPLGVTLDQLLIVPLAQTEAQLIINELSTHITKIQMILNQLTIGDPFSGKQDLLVSLQAESGVLSLHNQLSAVSIGLQKLISALTDSFVSRASFITELALKNDIQSALILLSSLSDQPATYPDCSIKVYLDSVPVNLIKQITNLKFTMSREVSFDVLSFSSSDVALYTKLQKIAGSPDSAIEIQYRGSSWFFLIEEVSGYELNFCVWGRSIAAAKSDAPFKDSSNFVLETDTLASDVADDLVPDLFISWNTVDWTIMAGWSVEGTPLQMLKTLADSVGAVVRSYPDGTGFYVDEKYTTRPVDLSSAVAVEEFNRDIDLVFLSTSSDSGTGSNAVTVQGYSPFSKYSIRLEADSCVDVGNLATIKVYPALGGVGYTLVASDGVPAYQHSLSEEHVEIVSFVGGKGSASYPITALKSITWDGVVPAGFEYTAGQDEIVLTDDTLAAVGEVAYTTRYDVWHGAHSGEGQLLVVCCLEEGGGIVAKVYFGDGDREAENISRPNLTSTEAVIAAGRAFLDDTSYIKRIRNITVPCSGASDGAVISIKSDISGVVGNAFVLSHEVSVLLENEALKVHSIMDTVQFEV